MTTMIDNSVFESMHLTEEWRYTNVSALSKIDFLDKVKTNIDNICEYDISPNSPFVVFINGVFNEQSSRLVEGISVNSGKFGTVSSRSDSQIPRGKSDSLTITGEHKKTIHVLQIISGNSPTACFGNVFIHANEGESISVSQTHAALGDCDHLFMPCTEVVAKKNSSVTLLCAIRGSKYAYHLGSLHVKQHEASKVQTHIVTLGGRRTRNEVYAYLDGKDCESNFDGMYMLGLDQFVDNHLRVEHNEPSGKSREFYKGVLVENAKSVFTGRIFVKEDAQQTDAKQTNQNILLSDDAEATSRPQLEIYADDVKCTHGATTGEIDQDALLYLRSRGIPADSAKTLLIFAFLNESLEELSNDTFRQSLQDELLANLPGGEFIRNL